MRRNVLIFPVTTLVLVTSACLQAQYDVKVFGAKGDGNADDIVAINNAIRKASADGGGEVLLPPGIYKTGDRIQLVSRVHLLCSPGAKIKNIAGNSPANHAVDIVGLLGPHYSIRRPAASASTVITAVAGDAGNFQAGEVIGLSGDPFHGDYVPFFMSKVVSVNRDTGTIALANPLRRTDISLVHRITVPVVDSGVEGCTFIQSNNYGVFAKYADRVIISSNRFQSPPAAIGVVGSSEASITNNVIDDGDCNLHSTVDSVVRANVFHSGSIKLDGGSSENKIESNRIIQPLTNGIMLLSQSQRNVVAFNTVTEVAARGTGIRVDGTAVVESGDVQHFGENTIRENTIAGGVGASYGIVVIDSDKNVITSNKISGVATPIIEKNSSRNTPSGAARHHLTAS